MSRRFRRTEIATILGPVADRDNNLEKIIATGANVVCMNFSHSSPKGHKLRANKIREIAVKLGRHVAILGDLRRPKIRVPTFREDKVLLDVGGKFLLGASLGKGKGGKEKVGVDYKGLPTGAVPGDTLLLDDGRVQLKVPEVQGMKVFTEVTVGGLPSNNKDINKLDGGLPAEALTEKDKTDIITVVQINVDCLAASFPRCGGGLDYVRRLAHDTGYDAKAVAKVERAKAVCDQSAMDDIILASDVVMAARGDPGVGIGDPELVGIQKVLTRRVCQLSHAVITATQVMEPIITNPMPARAEVMSVTNAVLDGTDAAMLSTGAVVGQYPAETVTAMARVCLGAKKVPSINVSKYRPDVQFDNAGEAIVVSAMYAANRLKGVTVIITMAESGRTTLMTSRISSGLPIFAVSRHGRMLNLTSLHRGVTPVYLDSETDGVVAASEAVNLLYDEGYLISGDLVIITQDGVVSTIGSTSTTHILTVE